jgi:peptidoglycan hydrolase-like protein with peptidoglycan-binding domain
MKRTLIVAFVALLSLSVAVAAQTTKTSPNGDSQSATGKKRGPIFRATKDQITQAQNLLKQRGLYAGDSTGKLDADTRNALRKYQESEGIKVTGTLNRITLEKMSIALTDKQRTMT